MKRRFDAGIAKWGSGHSISNDHFTLMLFILVLQVT